MKRAQCTVTYPPELRHPLHEHVVTAGALTRAALLTWSPTPDATSLLWCDGDRSSTAAAVAAIDSVVASEFVEGEDGTFAFVHQERYEFADVLLETIADVDVVFVPPVEFEATGDVRFDAVGERAGLGRLLDRLSDLGSVTVDRVRPFPRNRPETLLTDRQQAALEAAIDVGYYEVPRDGSVEDVAGRLDCSASTAGELVRKAEAAVVREFCAHERSTPGFERS